MITYIITFLSGLFGGEKRRRAAYDKGFNEMTAMINSLRSNHDEYDPGLVYTARARLIGAYKGTEKDFGPYQEGIRDATTVYEREFGAP
jgi:hypothetical protein